MRTESAPPLFVSLLQTWPARIEARAETAPAKESDTQNDDARQRREAAAERRTQNRPLLAGNLRIELDAEAGRFVQTLTDPTTNEVLRRFPNESQLAFSRAARAYTKALQGSGR
jgi:uncharacterized FlaG/YvyC family protein